MKSIVWLILPLLLATGFYAQAKPDKFQKSFEKAESYSEVGQYFKAIDEIDKTIEKIKKKSQTVDRHLAFAYLMKAKYLCQSAQFKKMKAYRKSALKLVEESLQNQSEDEVKIFELLYDVNYEYGNYLKAQKNIEHAIEVLSSLPEDFGYWGEVLRAKKFRVEVTRGFNHAREKEINELVAYFKTQMVEKIEVYDSKKGRSKMEKLSKFEILERKRNFFHSKMLRAELYISQGQYHRALDTLENLRKPIKKEFTKGSNLYVDFLMTKGYAYEGLREYKLAYKEWEDVLDAIRLGGKSNYSKKSRQFFEGHEHVIRLLLYNDQPGYASTYIADLRNSFQLDYRYDNIYKDKAKLGDALTKVFAGNLNGADRDFLSLLADTLVLPMDHPERAKIELYLYKSREKNERFVSAFKAMVRYRDVVKAVYGESSPVYYRTGFDLADFYLHHTDGLDTAEFLFYNGFRSGVDGHWTYEHEEYIDHLFQFFDFVELQDDFGSNLDSLNKLKAFWDKNGWRNRAYARILIKLSEYAIITGDIKQSVILNAQAKELLEELGLKDSYEYAELYLVEAKLNSVYGDFRQARKNYKRAERTEDNAYKYDPFYLMEDKMEDYARLLIQTGSYGEATKITEDRIADYEKRLGKKTRLLIPSYNNKALLDLLDGDFASAEIYFQKAEKLSDAIYGEFSLQHSSTLQVGKQVYEEKGDFALASKVGRFVLEIQNDKLGEDHYLSALSLADLALIDYQLQNRAMDKLEMDLKLAMDKTKKAVGDQSPSYARVLTRAAIFYIYEEKTEIAEPLLEEAYNIWIQSVGKKSLEAGEIASIRGDLFLFSDRLEDAEEQYINAQEIFKKIFSDKHPLYVKNVSKLARVYYIGGDIKNCVDLLEESTTKYQAYIQKYFPSLSEREKNKYWNLVRPDFEFFNTVMVKDPVRYSRLLGDAYNHSLDTKAILLNSSIKVRESIMNSGNPTLIRNYQNWLSRKELLTQAIGMSEEELTEAQIQLDDLTEEVETLEKQLNAQSQIFADASKKTEGDWKDVRKTLEENEAAIEIIRFRKYYKNFTDSVYYAALIITEKTKGSPTLVMFENGAEMESKFFKGYRNRVKFKVADPISYRVFWEPIDTLLGPEISTVYLSMDGVYNQINLETLRKPDGSYVLDDRNLVLVSNTKVLLDQDEEVLNTKKTATLFGNPVFHKSGRGSLSPLPGAEKEVKDLETLLEANGWTCSTFLTSDASERSVKGSRNPKVLHIATHGFFVESPKTDQRLENLTEMGLKPTFDNTLLKSGLVLDYGGDILDNEPPMNFNKEDGLLTAYEAMNMNMELTDLVILSACETGRGDVAVGEGVYGLQRSLIVAGAKTVIMSLFKVSDEATQKLMYKFYTNWIKSNNKREAFLKAKREMKSEYKDPLYWGAFVMIGQN